MTITIGISLKITLFDVANAGVNLGLKFSTFYPIYFKSLGVFVSITAIIYPFSNILNISNWLEFLIYAVVISTFGYLVAFMIIFTKEQRAIFIGKIRGRF